MAFPENTVNDTGIKHIWDKVTAALSGKVDKVSGKGLSTNDYTTAEKDKLAGIESGAQVNTVSSVAGKTGAVTLDKADVGLGNVDNTSDASKPISTATQNALDTKADNSDVTETDTTNSTPFLYRKTPYEADRVFLDELVGGSVAWNQLVQNGNFADTSSWSVSNCSLSASNNEATITVANNQIAYISQSGGIIANHRYLFILDIKTNSASDAFVQVGNDSRGFQAGSSYTKKAYWLKPSASTDIIVGLTSSSAGDVLNLKNVMVHDLTQMFGTTIADYVYSLEQATAGSGIAWLKSHGFFTKDYYPYNAGELISVKTSGKKYVGFNQWDEEYLLGHYNRYGVFEPQADTIASKNPIQVFPNTTYYLKSGTYHPLYILFYDENMTFIRYTSLNNDGTFSTPNNARYVHFNNDFTGSVYNHDICINISKTTGTPKNGDYVPYEEHTYDISNIDLRGIPKLVNNELVYDGDTYESNGDVTRKYVECDLGDLNWVYHSNSGNMYADNALTGRKAEGNSICSKYLESFGKYGEYSSVDDLTTDKTYGLQYNLVTRLIVRDTSYTDAATFKTAMSGVYLVYEKATPTTETTDPFTNPQICDKDGTEEFIDNRTVPVPVGHNSTYANLPSMMDGRYLNYMVNNFASKEYTDRAVEGKADNTTAYVDLPGNYDTTNKNFPTRSATSGSVENCLTYINDLADKLYTAINSHATALANIPTKTVVVNHRAIDVGDEFNISLPLSYKFLIIELTIILTDEVCYGSIVSTDFANGSVLSIVANGHGLSYWCDLSRIANTITVDGNFDSAHGELTITAF